MYMNIACCAPSTCCLTYVKKKEQTQGRVSAQKRQTHTHTHTRVRARDTLCPQGLTKFLGLFGKRALFCTKNFRKRDVFLRRRMNHKQPMRIKVVI